ncbi:MAG TPA: efflux RND transporter periplasmic adaptor subunit, partial [Candidatus Polarisedimenticolaceae bacterium]|nr:efflux RND transporter periplasmic adaptor subunit [Candidatus Polarisedimenticolaceae bacterium]
FKMATKDADLASLRIDRSFQRGNSPRQSRTKRKVLIAFVVALILAAAIVFLRDLFDPAVEVQLATVALTSASQTQSVLTASGYVVARRKAAVASKGTGRLVLLNVEEGDQVKKGQLIARLEDADVIAARERARQSLRFAEADLYDAKTSYERSRILLKDRAVAQAEYDVAEARYKRVIASIDVARFALEEAEVAVENTRIIAPFDGTVLKKNADVGEIVAPLAGAASSKAAVVTIADMSSLEVDADVSEANITRVAPDQQCEITLDAYPQQRYPGYVTKIVPTADRSKATVLVKIKFKEYDQRVLPEMSAKISFLAIGYKAASADHKLLLTVPESAVANRDGRAVIYQIRDDRAIEVPVNTGQKLGGLIEIKSGIKEGDKIIAKVDDRIEAGAKVAIKGP